MSDTNEELLPPAIDETSPSEAPPPLPTNKDDENDADADTPTEETEVTTTATETETSTAVASSPAVQVPIPQPPPLLISTFPDRLESALNGPYTVNMRRSVQTCILLEADRCLRMQYKRLKAFQRKVALHDTASDIVDTLEFIPPHYRIEIMYRTATSKVMLSPELTWRRMKLIDREIRKTIIPKIMEIDVGGKSHEEICNVYLQREYEKVSGKKDPYHPNWEYSHDNHFTAYRMFYLGADVNPNLPPAVDPNPERVVPSQKPKPEFVEAENLKRAAKTAAAAFQASKDASMAGQAVNQILTSPASAKRQRLSAATAGFSSPGAGYVGLNSTAKSLLGVTPLQAKEADEAVERRALLKEIKDHLDILNEFKGIIPESELVDRKRNLFALLPKPTEEI